MSVKEACEKLGISRVTLMRRIKDGKLTPLPKAPGQLRAYKLFFRPEDIERLAQGSGN